MENYSKRHIFFNLCYGRTQVRVWSARGGYKKNYNKRYRFFNFCCGQARVSNLGLPMAVIDEMYLDNRSTVFFFQSIILFCKNLKKMGNHGSLILNIHGL